MRGSIDPDLRWRREQKNTTARRYCFRWPFDLALGVALPLESHTVLGDYRRHPREGGDPLTLTSAGDASKPNTTARRYCYKLPFDLALGVCFARIN